MSDLKVVYIDEKNAWEKFVLSRPEANFLQSWNWGVFQKRMEKKVFPLGFDRDGQLVGVALIVKETAKRGNYLTVAGGPLLDWEDRELELLFVSTLRRLAKEEKCLFVRVRSQLMNTQENRDRFSSLGFKEAPMHLTADLTRQIDLTKTEEELLMEMRKSTRYEIRKADKEGVKIKMSSDPNEMEEFYTHQLELAKRHGFVPFSKKFLTEQFATFAKDDQALLIHSYKNSQLLASAFVIFYGVEAVYHYGVSTAANSRLPGAYACQWAAIKMAKDMGMKRYNLWGVAPENSVNHRFYGVSIFKRGFGGEDVAHLPAQDLGISKFYLLVKLFESLRARARKL
jgi:lipid II:glycine glycyltransferase (peptidoglycan interpeptide bridge formation enzyme)